MDLELGEFIELKRGYDLPKQTRELGQVPIVSSAGVTDHHSRAMVRGPGIVTGRYGTIGQVFYVKEDFWPLNTTLYVRDFKGAEPRFVEYLLKTVDFMSCSDKAAVPGVNRNHLHRLKVRVPRDISTQREVASILGSFDDKIELNRKTNETLESIAGALFSSWFVEYAGLCTYEDVLTLTGSGILQIGDGYRAKNSELGDSGLPFVRVADIRSGKIAVEGAERLSSNAFRSVKDKASLPYDIVLTTKGTVGRSAFVSPRSLTFVYSPQLCFWRCLDPSRLNPYFMWNWMQSRWFLDQIDKIKGQTDMADYVSLGDQRRVTVPVPPVESQVKLCESLELIQERIWHNFAESDTLAQTRDALLPALLSGALPLHDATRILL